LSLAERFAIWSQTLDNSCFFENAKVEKLTLVLACRNTKKANNAVKNLLNKYSNPRLIVETLSLDTSDLDSVVSAAKEIEKRFEYVNFLFCNAGALYIKSLNWKSILNGILTHPIEFLGSTEALNQEVGLVSKQNLGLSFATNFFGHYALIRKITHLMKKAPLVRRIIWTGSHTSIYGFDKSDIQHIRGQTPYESSKYLTDQISVLLDTEILAKYKIRSIVTEPGNVSSNILSSLGNNVLNFLVYISFLTIRLIFGVYRLTTTPWNGSYAAYSTVFVSDKDLDGTKKSFGLSSRLGHNYVTRQKIEFDETFARSLIQEFDSIIEKKTT
ncbi:hypothetical protein BB561_004796, partial [Smittium simulii]